MPAQPGRRRRDARRVAGGNPAAAVGPAVGAGGPGGPLHDRDRERSASELFKDAQSASTELKGLLQRTSPWSREVDALRTRARNTYLAVIFQHPLSPQAQSLDSLWLGTTYVLISAYRDAVARLESTAHDRDRAALGPTLGRFRTALAAEEGFYRSLVSRVVGFYKLQARAADALDQVGIPSPLPSDDAALSTLSREEGEKKLQLVYKGLICLGDLERYKEQYDKSRGRDGTFDKAITYYEVARGLQPDNGTAFNQLAVIDGYLGEGFDCTYHYYRALAVRQPFPSGDVNLERVLKRAFERWRADREVGTGVDGFKRDVLSACAILHLRAGTSHFVKLYDGVMGEFAELVKERKLPSGVIVKTAAMVIGAHWCSRLGRDANEDEERAKRRRNVEELALKLLLGVFGVLMKTAGEQVAEALRTHKESDESAVADDDEVVPDLAQRITPVLRRILPSLRIMSRWLKCHLEYVNRLGERSDVGAFWGEYKAFTGALGTLFPLVQLPTLQGPLEEDVDMRGFLPLRRSLSDESSGGAGENGADSTEDIHPNEQQLMRIADLLVDVKLVVKGDTGPPQAPEEDDPVNLAMRATLNEASSVVDEEEEEVIIAPVIPGTEQTATAQDLLQNLTLAPPPPSGLLFGDSIWSMSREESQKGKSRAAAAAAWHSDEASQSQHHAQWQPGTQAFSQVQPQSQTHAHPHPHPQPHPQPPSHPPPGFGAPAAPPPGFSTPPGFTTPPNYSTPPGLAQQGPQPWPRSRPQSGNNIWGAPGAAGAAYRQW